MRLYGHVGSGYKTVRNSRHFRWAVCSDYFNKASLLIKTIEQNETVGLWLLGSYMGIQSRNAMRRDALCRHGAAPWLWCRPVALWCTCLIAPSSPVAGWCRRSPADWCGGAQSGPSRGPALSAECGKSIVPVCSLIDGISLLSFVVGQSSHQLSSERITGTSTYVYSREGRQVKPLGTGGAMGPWPLHFLGVAKISSLFFERKL